MSRQSNKISRRKEALRLNSSTPRECYIHNDARGDEKDVHENVCVKSKDYPLTKFDDGKYYCLFHLPTRNKDIDKFEKFFRLKLSEIENIIAENKLLIKKNEEPTAVSYNFHYVWFPSRVNFLGHTFAAPVFFRNATFSRGVEFGATFKHQAQFHNATFLGTVVFAGAGFYDGAYFLDTVFSSDAYFSNSAFYDSKPHTSVSFNGAIFLKKAYFKETLFIAETTFRDVVFEGNTYFSEAKFLNENMTFFSFTKFERDTFFDKTEFHHSVTFNSAVFGKDSDLIFRKTIFEKYVSFRYATSEGYVRFVDLKQGDDNRFNFQEAAFENASRVFFYKARLQPFWFVNVDSRRFDFIDINDEFDDVKVKTELANLGKIKIKNSKQVLKVTFRQLAENAESNNRFEEASKFRQKAFECERLERKEKFRQWSVEEFTCLSIWLNLWRKIKSIPFDFAHFAYRWTSSYGESWSWAAFVLIIIIFLVFPILYTLTKFQISPKAIPLEVVVLNKCEITEKEKQNGKDELIDESKKVCHKIEQRGLGYLNGEAILHSFTAVTFQDVEYRRPLSFWAEFWTILERILAPLQATLLALAIRRKFMR